MRLLIAALAALTLAGTVQAQTSVAPRVVLPLASQENPAVAAGDAEWGLRVSPRLVDALGSSSSAVRAAALHAVGNLAYASPDGVDLRPAIPALLEIVRSDPDRRHRVMALRSLQASADEGALATLWAEAHRETDPYVQRTLLAVLADHYGVSALVRDSRMVAMAQSLLEGRRMIAAR